MEERQVFWHLAVTAFHAEKTQLKRVATGGKLGTARSVKVTRVRIQGNLIPWEDLAISFN